MTKNQQSLKVAIISDAALERNGVGSYYQDLADHLDRQIGAARIYCPELLNSPWQRYLTAPLPGDGTQRVSLPPALKLHRQLTALSPDAIVIPTPGPFGLIGVYLARKLGIPMITGFHTHYEALAGIYWENSFGQLCTSYLKWCNRLLFRNSALVLANSPDMVHAADSLGATSTDLMRTSLERFFIEQPVNTLPQGADRILFTGRLAEEKNIDKMLQLAKNRPELTVTIAGDGPLREKVSAHASQLANLHYAGWVQRHDLIKVMDDNDVLVLPSKVESFGTVALEAMSRARLVVVSDSCGITQWQELGQHLFTLDRGTTLETLIDHIRTIPTTELQSRAEQARDAAVNFSQHNVSDWISRIEWCKQTTGESLAA